MKKVVMGLSGGMDSATLLGYFLSKGVEVHVCHFQYGSKHNPYEKEVTTKLLQYFSAKYNVIIKSSNFNLTDIFKGFKSNLLMSGGEIPEGHYEEESMRQTVVPGRNTIFASIMAGLAESVGADLVALGVHSGDHHIYPDCRQAYINELSTTIHLATDEKVRVFAPFINDNKESILRIGYAMKIPVPYELTRTCYKNQKESCGKCGSCRERLEAFEALGRKDPIKYEEGINE